MRRFSLPFLVAPLLLCTLRMTAFATAAWAQETYPQGPFAVERVELSGEDTGRFPSHYFAMPVENARGLLVLLPGLNGDTARRFTLPLGRAAIGGFSAGGLLALGYIVEANARPGSTAFSPRAVQNGERRASGIVIVSPGRPEPVFVATGLSTLMLYVSSHHA